MEDVLEKLRLSWPSALVSRSEVSRFSGGVLNARTLANLDSQGEGPRNRVRVGRKIAYPVDSLVAWLESRSSEVDQND